MYDLALSTTPGVSYGDVFLENEKSSMSTWNFEVAETDALFDHLPQGR